MRKFLKEEIQRTDVRKITTEVVHSLAFNKISLLRKAPVSVACVVALIVVSLLATFVVSKEADVVSISEAAPVQVMPTPVAATTSKKTTITIPSGTIKANPFLPYREISGADAVKTDVPAYSLVEPPEVSGASSDAIRVMDTIVSGILFDKFSPSAILNIEGNDYLVKKGDVVNNYKVLNIAQDSVTVQLGANTYKAGIGEILTEGSLNHNDVSNLSNKFGGVNNEL